MKELAAKGLAIARAAGALKGVRGASSGEQSEVVTALRGLYRTPWQIALQRWMESVAPGERTFFRLPRRGGLGQDIVLPGRRRQGWMLNLVLDTSGSMSEEIPRALGAIADFSDGIGVDQVRIVQCDVAVTVDELVPPDALATYRISGYGGSDLSPAMLRLAEDPHVRAAIVITDGDITYPREPMPYDVLWVLPMGGSRSFNPPYGRSLPMLPG
jgi:predicted metal-dependent peptidase